MKPYAFELIFKHDTSAILKDNNFIRKTWTKIWINSLWASLNGGHDDDQAVEENNKKIAGTGSLPAMQQSSRLIALYYYCPIYESDICICKAAKVSIFHHVLK